MKPTPTKKAFPSSGTRPFSSPMTAQMSGRIRSSFVWTAKGLPDLCHRRAARLFQRNRTALGQSALCWGEHEKTGFAWWLSRIQKRICRMSISFALTISAAFPPAGRSHLGQRMHAAANGLLPRRSIFYPAERKARLSSPLIAEDLGIITDEVAALRDFAGLPGMRILQFAFGQEKTTPIYPIATIKIPLSIPVRMIMTPQTAGIKRQQSRKRITTAAI